MEKAIFVAVMKQGDDPGKIKEYLDELEFLAETAGAKGEKRFVQRLEKANSSTYIGRGKLEEIKAFIEENSIDLVIFDDELTPSQLRNIERELQCRILDRTNLILDIFAQRAKTAYAKTQVELAQYQYLLPRLTRMWTHLERQRGGIGMRGPGESQIETDRRIILEKISKLKEQLKKIDRQMASQRGNRGSLVRISLVGYTNVGKSTIMNLLAKSDVRVVFIGGEFDYGRDGFVGSMALEMIKNFRFDISFMGVVGVDIHENSVTTYMANDGIMKKEILAISRNSYMMCEFEKLKQFGNYKYAGLDEFTGIILDKEADSDLTEILKKYDIEIK